MSLTEIPGGPPPPIKVPDRGREVAGITRTTPDKTTTRRPHRRARPGTADQQTGEAFPQAPDRERDSRLPRWALGLGTALGMIPAAKDVAETTADLINSSDTRILFEPGDHLVDADMAEAIKRFQMGDLSQNAWQNDKGLAKRLASMKPRISVASVDGLSVTRKSEIIKPKAKVFFEVPKNINPDGVYVIAGDSTYSDAVSFTQLSGGLSTDKLGSQLDSVEVQDGLNSSLAEDAKRKKELALIIGAATTALLLYGGKSRMSRRTMLGMTVAVGAAAAFAGSEFLRLAGEIVKPYERIPSATGEQSKRVWQIIDAYVKTVPDNDWLDGRTARAVAKQEDGMETLRNAGLISDDAIGGIFYGYNHDTKGPKYLNKNNQAERDEAMLKLATHLVKVISIAADNYGVSESDKGRLIYDALENYTSMDIYHLTDPSQAIQKATTTKDPTQAGSAGIINQCVNLVTSGVEKYSHQVRDAIRSLYPPQFTDLAYTTR